MNTNVTDAEIQQAFTGTNFGGRDPRALLSMAILKALTGYYSGHTITQITRELGLTNHLGKVTTKGKDFCLAEFYNEGRNSA